MDTSPPNINPSIRETILLGVLWSILWSAAYLFYPAMFEGLQLKLMDAIVAGDADTGITDAVVVVDVDEQSLAAWGQWPWPRSRLAVLLDRIAGLGARSIALDFIMAEPDRTSPKALQSGLDYQPAIAGGMVDVTAVQDNDAILASTLAKGPFVLGYEFNFTDGGQKIAGCPLHPLDLVKRQHPSNGSGSLSLFQAQGVVCNLDQLARAAAGSGFLNGQPDGDGRLRRLPLVIRWGQDIYPNLALAALLTAGGKGQPAMLEHRQGSQTCLILGDHRIPIDDHGNMRIRFTGRRSGLRHMSADRVLNGQITESEVKGRIVLVGVKCDRPGTDIPLTGRGAYTAVEIHAQAVETILSKGYIRRHREILYLEVIFSVLVAVLLSLCIARLEFVPAAAIGTAGIVGCWGGAQLIFSSRQILVSPLLPAAVIATGGLFLMLFKYWTRQRKARQNLQEALILMKNSERHLNAIIQTIPDIVFRLDASGRITFISPAIAKYQKTPEALIGRHILDLVAAEDRESATRRINERRTGERATTDLEVRLMVSPGPNETDGDNRYFSVSAEGIYTKTPPDGQSFLGTQGIARDINRRRHLEHKLEQSKKMEAMGSLAAGVAHDLNNILSGLVSYPELLLLDLPADSPMRESIKTIQRSGQRAADIVQDLLMIARRSVKNHDIINLNHAVEGYLKAPEFKRLSQNHPKTRVVTKLADDLMNIKGSAVHISKVIMNLVGNAAEAMPAGGAIGVMTRNRYLDTAIDRYEKIPEGEYVVLCVSDEGIGIPPEAFNRIFEPFYSKKRMGRSGSGLGMTVVWNTIKDHGGFVDIQSREGDGTRFHIFLPATREADNQTRRRVVLQDYTGSERILVVDDVPEQLDIAVRMLGKLGYRVSSAAGGEEAVAFMETRTVDLLVLDMVMPPGMDGLETYRRILNVRPGQKAIIASGYAPSDRVKAMQDLGAGGYIRKPYTLEKIGLAVRRELDRQ